MEIYSENPTVRGLVELAKAIPVAGSLLSVFDATVVASLERYREQQFATFLDEISISGLDPNAPIPEGKQFEVIRAILITTEAVARSHREEKIRAFARLLVSGLQEPSQISIRDELEDYVNILDEVSWRELQMMAILAGYETSRRTAAERPDNNGICEYWDAFLADLTTRLSIPASEVSGLLARLGRTGLYEVLVIPVYGGGVTVGALTGIYYRLAKTLQPNSRFGSE